MNKEEEPEELRFIRALNADLINPSLVEQIKGRNYSVDDFYAYHRSMLTRNTPQGMKLNAFSQIHYLVNSENGIVGFLWFDVEPLSKDLIVQALSVDKKYWDGKKIIPMVADFLREVRDGAGLKSVLWLTSRPKAFEKFGFKKSKISIVEAQEQE